MIFSILKGESMKAEFEKARVLGMLVKRNSFDTQRGKYIISLYSWRGDIYFFKYREGKLVECSNLSKPTKEETK